MQMFLPKIIILSLLPILFTSCFKSAEELKREKMVDQMHVELAQSKDLIATLRSQLEDVRNNVTKTSGTIEEVSHGQMTTSQKMQEEWQQKHQQLEEKINLLEGENNSLKETIQNQEKNIEELRKYLKQINSTLTKLTNVKHETPDALYKKANQYFAKNWLTKSLPIFEKLTSMGLSAKKLNVVYYYLGYIHKYKKHFDTALTYLSKIYTKYPKSPQSPPALLLIGQIFTQQKKTDQALAIMDEIIQKYPQTKEAKLAKEAKEKLLK